MCGIAGVISFGVPIDVNLLFEMTRLVSHRGPDGEGFLLNDDNGLHSVFTESEKDKWRDNKVSFGLGHRRLAILDLSQAGRQPMGTPDGQLWIVHNGEIYNYIEIRNELEGKGYRFNTHTDTEIILYAYQEWGEDCLSKFNGMWAFAILDLKNDIIFCSRDRAGIKPYYYFYDGKIFAFASEIKQLLKIPGLRPEVNSGILYDYILYGVQDHSEQTFYKNIFSLPGGHFIRIALKGSTKKIKTESYWDPMLQPAETKSDEDYAVQLLELLKDSINLRLRSDVPVGSCLSGGLDSSGIVGLLSKEMSETSSFKEQLTFSSCFDDPRWDERKYIKDVVDSTGVKAKYVFPSAEELLNILGRLTYLQDGPFGSTSIFAQWKVFESARDNSVTVMLDGQGADELLAGYYSYLPSFWWGLFAKRNWLTLLNEIAWFSYHHPKKVRGLITDAAKSFIYPRLKKQITANNPGWAKPQFIKTGLEQSPYNKYLGSRSELRKQKGGEELNWKLYESFRFTSLPALLHYEDRDSMAFSVEARLPFLDYRIIEFLLNLPPGQKINRGATKAVYRRAMKDYIPASVLARTDKMGFVTPEEVWVKKDLRAVIEETFHAIPDEHQFFSRQGLLEFYNSVLEDKIRFSFLTWRLFNSIIWLNSLKIKDE